MPAFVSHGREGVDDHGHVQSASSLTRATATRVVVACCASARSRTQSPSDGISVPGGRLGLVVRSPSTRRSTPVGMWSSVVSIGSSSGADWPPATKSAPPTIARWSSSPLSSSGSSRDSSDSPIEIARLKEGRILFISTLQSVQVMLTSCGELRAPGAVTVMVPLSRMPLTVTTC